jgi:hypothetical protein
MAVTLEEYIRFWLEADPLPSRGKFGVCARETEGKVEMTIFPQLAINAASDSGTGERTFVVSRDEVKVRG